MNDEKNTVRGKGTRTGEKKVEKTLIFALDTHTENW